MTKKIPCRLCEAEELVSEMDLFDVPDDVMESEEGCLIVVSGWWVHIPALGINLHESVFCNYDEEGKEYLPDFSVTAIMEADIQEPEGEWLYYEQDGFEVTLANYYSRKITMAEISEWSCFICIPEDNADNE